MKEPSDVRALCAHPINFIVGGPRTVADELLKLHAEILYDVANLEPSWEGFAPTSIDDCVRRLAEEVRPLLAVEGLTNRLHRE
jgi:hypothetical protein